MNFLVYGAHPKTVHATYTIYVWRNEDRSPNAKDLSRMCRNANNVRKTHLLAEFGENDDLVITKLEWDGMRKVEKRDFDVF